MDKPQLLTDFYLSRAREQPQSVAFHTLSAAGWEPTLWGDFVSRATRLAQALAALGLVPGQKLGIMAPTGLAWELFQLATLLNGAAVVGLDAHDQPERIAAIGQASQVAMLVVAGEGALARLDLGAVPSVRVVISLAEAPAPVNLGCRWSTWQALESGAEGIGSPVGPMPDALATIVFTSGSTGMPKGIGYTHAQVSLAVDSILEAFPGIGATDRLVCWLPLSNLFQRMLNFCAAGRGAQTYFVADPRTIMTQLASIRPQVFIAVPRFFEKLNEGIEQRVDAQPALARLLVRWALGAGGRRAQAQRAGRALTPWGELEAHLADRLVLRKLRAVMGGEIRFMVSGSAAFPRWLLEKFHAMGLLVLEAYGLSENVVPIAINRLDAWRFGTVGKVLCGNQVRIAEDGEIMVKGKGVFAGYLDAAGQAPLDTDGYLGTGDLGVLDGEGFLSLVGRKSEIFKTSTGRKIAPIGLEAKLKQIPGLDQVVIVGAGRKVTVALVTLAPASDGTLLSGEALRGRSAALARQVQPALSDESDYARPAGIAVLARPFSIESGELTANLKLRRKVIENNHATTLDRLFARLEAGGSPFCELLADDLSIASCEDLKMGVER